METLSIQPGSMGIFAILVFFLAYALVVSEEFIHLRKSKPVIIAAGLIWLFVALAFKAAGQSEQAKHLFERNLADFGMLMLFLLAAMTYVNTMQERNIFGALKSVLVNKGLSQRGVFWITGLLAFFISPVADNLTTALVMSAVLLAVAPNDKTFVSLGCINIVVAANAGGAFSPFGDITTLMVWQEGKVKFIEFFDLFLPSVVNWILPAFVMSLQISNEKTNRKIPQEKVRPGGWLVVALFALTIAMAVATEHLLHLPPMLGMMTGLGLLKLWGYWLKQKYKRINKKLALKTVETDLAMLSESTTMPIATSDKIRQDYDIFTQVQRAEWDTLLFFYGVIMCVGGLGAFGYLHTTSQWIYQGNNWTLGNSLVGVVSSVVDNIPVMFAVLKMDPAMPHSQWLLVTLTAGVGGSLLSVGSAAGVALMGQARGVYTFFTHLKWSWAIALGYIASIWLHLMMQQHWFGQAT